jgi:hypothetical protein
MDEFDAIAVDLVARGATRSQMMGRPMLKVGSTMFAALSNGLLAVRLGRESPEHADALALPGVDVWHPGGGARRFEDWVALPPEQEDEWMRFAEAGRRRASGRD